MLQFGTGVAKSTEKVSPSQKKKKKKGAKLRAPGSEVFLVFLKALLT